ncbi:MAG TPA: acyl-CoA dehydrogenase family protein, partial [Candidatus Hydrogenedentes bacterium]|nr:acyl-CoA dehydrogenase family protein [Candidatus Hydrogenedentota bacterium]
MVDFDLSEDQLTIRDTAARFARDVVRPAEIALDRMADPDQAFRSDVFRDAMRQAYELGFHKMGIKEEHGGLGLDPVTRGLVWEELAAGGVGIAAGLLAASVAPAFLSVLAPHKTDLIDAYV